MNLIQSVGSLQPMFYDKKNNKKKKPTNEVEEKKEEKTDSDSFFSDSLEETEKRINILV